MKIKDNRYFVLVKNTIVLGFGLVGAKLVQFVLLPFFTNQLTPAEYGVIDLSVTFISLMVPVVTCNLADGVLRFGLSKDVKKEEVLRVAIVILGVASCFTILLSPFFALYGTIARWRWYIVWMIIAQAAKVNFSLYIKANERVAIYSWDSVLTALTTAISDVVLISCLKTGIKGYFISDIIGNIFSILFLLFKGRIFAEISAKKSVNKKLFREMVTYSAPLTLNAVSWWIAGFSDRMVLDVFFSENEVGIYSVAAKMPAIVTTGLSVFTQAWIMSAIKEYETTKDAKFFQKVYHVLCAGLFSVVAVLILVIRPFMSIYVDYKFEEAWRYVPVLLLGVVFLGISNFYGGIYAAAKANVKEVRTTAACAVCNVVLNILLIPFYGIMGAAVATMLSYGIVAGIRMFDTGKMMQMKAQWLLLLINGILTVLEIIWIVRFEKIILAGATAGLILLMNGSHFVMKKKKG